MSTERRILSWSALAASLLACCPCAALSGFVAFIGAYSMLDGSSSASRQSNVFNLVAFGTVASVALVIGLALFAWGVRSLLAAEHGPDRSETGAGGDA
jgi:hypothetical protein